MAGVVCGTLAARRLAQARSELSYVSRYRYAIVNDVLDTAAAQLRAVVLHSRGEDEPAGVSLEKCCVTANLPAALQQVLDQFAVSA